MRGLAMTVTTTVVAYKVTTLPEDDPEVHHWTINVQRRQRRQWCIQHGGRYWNFVSGRWEYRSAAEDRYRYTDLDTALAKAQELAPLVRTNGFTAAEMLDWRERTGGQ